MQEGRVTAVNGVGAAMRGRHVPALDGVRGLAILLVLLHHFVAQTTATNRFEAAVNWLCSYGSLGVDLFFLLSGFLITGILYDSRAEPRYLRTFYVRRVLRIFPLYYGVLIVVFFVGPAIPGLQDSEFARLRQHQAWAWLYLVNVYLATHGGWVLSYIEHFWSLAVEEHFYLGWPLVVRAFAGARRTLLVLSLSVAAASFCGRVVAAGADVDPVAITVLTPFQLDALLLGAFFAVYVRQPGGAQAARRTIVPMVLIGAVVLVAQFGLHHLADFGPSAIRALRGGAFHVLLAALLVHAVTAPAWSLATRVFCSRWMMLLGKYSYGLYVYHHFVSYYCTRHGTEFVLASAVGSHTAAVAIQAAAGMVLSLVMAWLSYEFFERYFLQLKNRWPSNETGDVAALERRAVAVGLRN